MKDAGLKTRNDVRRYVNADWSRQEFNARSELNCGNVDLSKPLDTILGVDLPCQSRWREERPVNFSDEKPHLWFDNFAAIDPTQFNDLEIMGYSNLDVFKMYNHPPVMALMREKPGAPQELAFQRQRFALQDLLAIYDGADPTLPAVSEVKGSRSKLKGKAAKGKVDKKKKLKGSEKTEETEEDEGVGEFRIFEREVGYDGDKEDLDGIFQNFGAYDMECVNAEIPGILINRPEELTNGESKAKNQKKIQKRSEMTNQGSAFPAINLFVLTNGQFLLGFCYRKLYNRNRY